MATVYADLTDGYCNEFDNSSWAAARDATTSAGYSTNSTRSSTALRIGYISGGRGTQWSVTRTFMYFDTSGITDTLSEATLKIRGYSKSDVDFFVVKSTHGTSLSTADFDAITGWVAGADNSSNVTKYSSEVETWSTTGYNNITLNAAALSDMVSLSNFTICLIDADYDLPNNEPSIGTIIYTGMYYGNYTGTSYDPYIDYTVEAAAAADNAILFGANF